MKLWQKLQHCTGAGFTIFTALLALAVTTTPASAQNFLVEYTDDKLSVQGNNIQVKELLLEIQDKTGIRVNFIAEPKDTVSLNISEQSVENVIAKITENHMIIHDIINGKKTISELIIISDDPELKSSGGGSANLPSGQPAPSVEGTSPTEESSNEPTNKLNPENTPPTPTDNAPPAPNPN